MLVDTLSAIADLQPAYSPDNSPEMQKRGRLIRTDLASEIRELMPTLSSAMAEFGSDFIVEASDGIGRKTEAPWVRFASKAMSPTPRDGFYCVIHFSANGSAFWLTVGCGSTIWNGGDLRALPTSELALRTEWARSVVVKKFGTIDPFVDQIDLGAKAPLPKSFERATAFALRFHPASATQYDVTSTLQKAAIYLAEIYRAQKSGSHLTPSQLAELELEDLSRPSSNVLAKQGIGLTGPERRAVELRAMEVAREWLEGEGFSVLDKSANSSFDFQATRNGDVVKVEVKGTTSAACDDFIMTTNEIALHTSEVGKTALVLVSGIALHRGENCTASGGKCDPHMFWDIGDWKLEPMAYRVRRETAPKA